MRLKLTHGALACALVASPVVGAFAQTPAAPTQTTVTTTPTTTTTTTTTAQGRKTTVEFKTATRLPGLTLQPGSYVFSMGDPKMKQNVVEVYSSDGTQKIATLLTVDYPTAATLDQTTVLYPNTTTPTLRAWYFPGEPVGRAFVYTEDEARTVYGAASTPVLWATWDPNDTTVLGTVEVKSFGDQVADVAKAIGNATVKAAKAVGDKAEDVWDDVTDNAELVDPTESRKMAERHLDAAEKTYDGIDERLDDTQMASLAPMRAHLEALEDAFEKNDPSWMTHYTATIAALDGLAPERPVGTSGGAATLDVTTQASLGSIRAQLKLFHDQAMGK